MSTYTLAQQEIRRRLAARIKATRGKGIRTQIAAIKRTRNELTRIRTAKRQYERLPKKVSIKMPVFSEKIPIIGTEVKNLLPLGFLIPSQFGSKELQEPDYLKILGRTPYTFQYKPVLEPYRDVPPEEQEIQITPHPFFQDKIEYGGGVSQEFITSYPDYQAPFIPVINIPEIRIPEFPDIFGGLKKLGTYALLAIGGIAAILLLTKRK